MYEEERMGRTPFDIPATWKTVTSVVVGPVDEAAGFQPNVVLNCEPVNPKETALTYTLRAGRALREMGVVVAGPEQPPAATQLSSGKTGTLIERVLEAPDG